MTEGDWLACEDPVALTEYLKVTASVRKLRLLAVACCRRHWHRFVSSAAREAVDLTEKSADSQISQEAMEIAQDAVWAVWDEKCRLERERSEEEVIDLKDSQLAQIGSMAVMAAAQASCIAPQPSIEIDEEEINEEANFDCPLFHIYHCLGSLASCEVRLAALEAGRVYDPEEANLAHMKAGRGAEYRAHCGLIREIFGNPFRSMELDPAWLSPAVVELARSIYEDWTIDRMPILGDALEVAGCADPDLLAHCRETPGNHVRGCWVVDLLLERE